MDGVKKQKMIVHLPTMHTVETSTISVNVQDELPLDAADEPALFTLLLLLFICPLLSS